jgi:hypothetical protein
VALRVPTRGPGDPKPVVAEASALVGKKLLVAGIAAILLLAGIAAWVGVRPRIRRSRPRW